MKVFNILSLLYLTSNDIDFSNIYNFLVNNLNLAYLIININQKYYNIYYLFYENNTFKRLYIIKKLREKVYLYKYHIIKSDLFYYITF